MCHQSSVAHEYWSRAGSHSPVPAEAESGENSRPHTIHNVWRRIGELADVFARQFVHPVIVSLTSIRQTAVQSDQPHLLSGAFGAPGAFLVAASNSWTSITVRASPSANSARIELCTP
jgi:hypothetical protein